jgi:hypothetical protein
VARIALEDAPQLLAAMGVLKLSQPRPAFHPAATKSSHRLKHGFSSPKGSKLSN